MNWAVTMSSRLLITLFFYLKMYSVACKGNSSLTFIIDDTSSMRDVINEVIRGSHGLLDFVLKTKSSEIEELILVTFNDPGVALRTKTKSKTNFIRALDRIRVHGGGDCPEYSISGIIEALNISRSDSYLYVFTDANAKDFHRVGEVISLCEQKQSQVHFVLTGKCMMDENNYVYYNIAKACSGWVIEIDTREVHLAVDIIKHIVDNKKTIISSTSVTPHLSATPVSFTLDEITEYAIVTVSGLGAQFDIRTSNDFSEPTLSTEKIMWTRNFKVVKLINNNPGTYTAWVHGKGEVSVVVYGKKDLTFDYGFSDFVPKYDADTSQQVIAGKEHHLSISIRDLQHEIDIKNATILTIDEKVIMELTLSKIETDFYVTDHFLPPETTFKVAVKGVIIKTGKPILRVSKVAVKPRSLRTKRHLKIESEFTYNYKEPANLLCFSHIPITQYEDTDGNVYNLQVSPIKPIPPYKFTRFMPLNNTKPSTIYICTDENFSVHTSSAVAKVNVRSPLKKITTLPVTTYAKHGKDLKLKCLIQSSHPAETIWQWQWYGPRDKVSLSADGSELTITDMDMNYEGQYTCKVTLKENTAFTEMQMTQVKIDLESPKIITDKTEYRGVVGDKVLVITCRVLTGYPEPTIVWKNSKNEIIETGSKYIVKGNSKSQSLSILNPTINDIGNLICEAKNKLGTMAKYFNVFVVTDVSDQLGNKHYVYLLENESKDISCTLPNSDHHSFRWYKNLTDLTTVTGITYSIKNADVSDDGNYTCRADTDIGSVSETFIVDVGYKPVFENDDPATWFGDRNDLVDCTVRAKPAAKVEWFVNGEKTNNKEFEHPIQGWGNYTCKVSNVHGVAVKTSIVSTPGCLINRTMEEKNNPPFILNTNIDVDSEDPAFNNNEYMLTDPGQKMKLTCYKPGKNTFNLFPEKDTIIAECHKEDKFISDGKTYKYSDLKCKEPLVPVITDTKKNCINVNSTVIKLGFEVPSFVEVYEICYDNERKQPNFGYSKVSSYNLGNREKKSSYEAGKGMPHCDAELKCCYGQGQLVNAADVDIGPPQTAPLIDLNAISMWIPCTKESRTTWQKLEEAVRSLLLSYNSIHVWSGASEYENVNGQRVPRFLWKVLKANEEIIVVLVYVNTPEPKPEDIKCKKPVNIQSQSTQPEELAIGDDPYTYLCSLGDFSKEFDVPMDTFNK